MQKEMIARLATERSQPCISILLNTHRTHPDTQKDAIAIKNAFKEAEERVLAEYPKRSVTSLLERLERLPAEIDVNYNLDSIHIFLSNDTEEVVKSIWPVAAEGVYVDEHFAVRPLIKAFNRSEPYYILLPTQDNVHLYEALNDHIVSEVRNGEFPIKGRLIYGSDELHGTDAKRTDRVEREFFNRVDKAVIRATEETGWPVIVISIQGNYNYLLDVADRPQIYQGFAPVNYNDVRPSTLAAQAWEIVSDLQFQRRSEAIQDVKAAISAGKVLTDLNEIYRAAREGRGDLLVVHQDYTQPVMFRDEQSFDYADDSKAPGVVDDIISMIAWEVISKNGRAVFTRQEELSDLGEVALKVRF